MMVHPEKLGSEQFRQDYGVRFAYVAGAMVKAIASPELVIRMARAGYLSFYGAGGMTLAKIEAALQQIQAALPNGEAYGVNLLANPASGAQEMALVDVLLRHGVRHVEASAFIQITPALVKFRLTGATVGSDGKVVARNRVIAKLSRPEVAAHFLRPAAPEMVARLLASGAISAQEAALAGQLPVASDLCVEADSGGHTDMGVMTVLLPTMIRLRDQAQQQYQFAPPVRVGAGGGIGTPESAACAFLLGADFIVTGSINQCTVEAGTSAAVKDMLQEMQVQDCAYAPAGDMFEIGSRIQVLKRGVLFAVRANRLYDLWRSHGALEQIDADLRREIQERYFRRSFDEVYAETKAFYLQAHPPAIDKAERDPKARMALIFRWYFVHTMRMALKGEGERVDYQIHTGPALGACNLWLQHGSLRHWRARHVDLLAAELMQATADYMARRLQIFVQDHR